MSDFIELLRSFPSRLRAAVEGSTDSERLTLEKPGAWSIANVVAHLDDFELVTAVRVRLMVAEENPRLPSFSEKVWVARFHQDVAFTDLLQSVVRTRESSLRLIESLSAEELERLGTHPNYGDVTLARILQLAAEHQEKHLAQIERIKRATRQAGESRPAS